MSTRSNIVIKKDGFSNAELYHHHDGYPKGVGCGLQKYMKEIRELPEAESAKIMSSPESLAKWLSSSEREDEYEYETPGLHVDIEYLYVINLDENTVTCYSVDLWDYEGDDETIINGCGDADVEEEVYYCGLDTPFENVIFAR